AICLQSVLRQRRWDGSRGAADSHPGRTTRDRCFNQFANKAWWQSVPRLLGRWDTMRPSFLQFCFPAWTVASRSMRRWSWARCLWPLVPLVWAFVPAGLAAILPTVTRRAGQVAIASGLLALCVWQSMGSAALIETNQRYVADRDAFFQNEAPGFYFSDWRQA